MNKLQKGWWFLAGASIFHAPTHIFYWLSDSIPLDFKWFTVTTTLNQIEIGGSVSLGAVFIYLAEKQIPTKLKS